MADDAGTYKEKPIDPPPKPPLRDVRTGDKKVKK